jgi:tetratricopeptide (TPR) repeat protein
MLKSKDALYLSFDLVNINSGKVLWKNKWTESIINEKNIRRHIITAILEQFNLQLTDQLAEIYSENITDSKQALEMYYKAKYYSDNIQSANDLNMGRNLLESAIKLDNNFVVAYALHALVLQRLGHYGKAETYLDKGKNIALSKNDIQGLASIHNISNIVYFTQGKYQKALEHIESALEYQMQLNNKLKLAKYRANYAQCLNQLNEIDLAIEQNKESIKLKKELEDIKSLGASYAVLANTYFSKGDFSLALETGIKAIAIFRANKMVNFEARALVLVSDSLMHLGRYKEMRGYTAQAESILADFDEPFLIGKLELMHSHYRLNENDINAAIDHVDSCIDLFEIAEQKPFLIDAYIHKMNLLIRQNTLSKANRVMSKINMQFKKLAGSEERPLLGIFRLLLSPDNLEPEIIQKIENQLPTSTAADQISAYWHLSRIYTSLDDSNSSQESLNKAKEIINQQAMIISNDEDRDCFINQVFLHRKISGELSESALDHLYGKMI